MWKELREIGCLSEDQIFSIQNFLLSDSVAESAAGSSGLFSLKTPLSAAARTEEKIDEADDDESSEESTEEEAGVADWDDFGESSVDNRRNNEFAALDAKFAKTEPKKNTRWLQRALISAAGYADIIVLAFVQKIVVLERGATESEQFHVIAQFSANDRFISPSVYIRSICVLPVACNRRTETSAYDWVAIAVGLSSGHVRFFTERGVLLRSEQFYTKPIDSIRFGKSFLPGNQELAILSSGRMTVIEGLSLFTALKTAKIQIARGETDMDKIVAGSLLNIERFRLETDIDARDFAVLGPFKQTALESYIAASLSPAGFNAKCDGQIQPLFSTYIFTGPSPFVAFGWNREGSSAQNIIADTIYNLGSQITSSVTSSLPSFGFRSYFGIGVSRKDRPQITTSSSSRISTYLATRSTIVDEGREGERVFPGPSNSNLAAVTDSLARITLIDVRARRIIRMWKGYRDARCAWLESYSAVSRPDEPDSKSPPAKALFLVIFAPRRGLLEIWAMQNGWRVSAVNVDRRGRLFGVPRLEEQLLGTSTTGPSSPSAFFISSCGHIFQLAVPFHLALSDDSSAGMHDENLLREMRQLGDGLYEAPLTAWLRALRSLKTASALRSAVDMPLQNRTIEIHQLGAVIDAAKQIIESNTRVKGTAEGRSLLHYVCSVAQLLDAYAHIWKLFDEKANRTLEEEGEGDEVAKRLCISKPVLETCIRRMTECNDERSGKVDIENFHFSDFLLHFDISKGFSARSVSDPPKEWIDLHLKYASPVLGCFIFFPVLTGRCTLQHFSIHIMRQINISQTDLLEVFCSFWLHPGPNSDVFYLPRVLSVFERLAIAAEFATQWLNIVEERINESTETAATLSLCLLARAVALNRDRKILSERKDAEKQGDVTGEDVRLLADEEWDEIEPGLERWDLLLKHLQCIALLKSLPNCPQMCLKELTDVGPAYYREKIAVWVCAFKPDVGRLLDVLTSKVVNDNLEESSWERILAEFASLFPLSLSAELVFCDCAWECVGTWNRDPDKTVSILQYALKFLKELECSARLQHGLCLLIWDTFLRQPFRQLFDLLNKTGRFPKDRLARKQVGVCESQLVDFAKCCSSVLRMLSSAVRDLEQCMPISLQYEDFVEVFFDMRKDNVSKARREPLSAIVSRQKAVNYHLVLHHFHLSTVIELQLSLCCRLRPVQLFDAAGARALFDSFHAHPLIPIANVSASVQEKRQNFLESCVTTIGTVKGEREKWNQIVLLASDWELDIDALRIKEITLLYMDGADADAERLIAPVESRRALSEALFPIVVARIRCWIDSERPNALSDAQRLSISSTRMSNCIRSTGNDIAIANTPSREEILRSLEQLRILLSSSSPSDDTEQMLSLVSDFEDLIVHVSEC